MSARRHEACRETWLTLSALKWRGLAFLDGLAISGADLEVLASGDRAALARVEGLQPGGIDRLLAGRAAFDLGAHLRELERRGLTATTPADAGWPEALGNLVDAPLALYHRGPLPGRELVVGIVGTRAATPYGLAVARQLARELAESGVVTISGLAQGIDGAAHAGALDAAAGRTIAVLAGGADVIYPPGHHALYARIVARGTVLSEVPPGVRMARWLFPLRNRIVSGLCRALVVVEAPAGSGALITARHAGDQGRDVLVVPGPVTSPASAGSHQLVRDGAVLVTGAADVLAAIGADYHPKGWHLSGGRPASTPDDEMLGTEDVRKVLDLLRGDALEADEILKRSGMRSGRLYRLLLDLAAAGVVSRLPGNRWMKAVGRPRPAQLGEGLPAVDAGALYSIQSGGSGRLTA